jgi:hypothetical protein
MIGGVQMKIWKKNLVAAAILVTVCLFGMTACIIYFTSTIAEDTEVSADMEDIYGLTYRQLTL